MQLVWVYTGRTPPTPPPAPTAYPPHCRRLGSPLASTLSQPLLASPFGRHHWPTPLANPFRPSFSHNQNVNSPTVQHFCALQGANGVMVPHMQSVESAAIRHFARSRVQQVPCFRTFKAWIRRQYNTLRALGCKRYHASAHSERGIAESTTLRPLSIHASDCGHEPKWLRLLVKCKSRYHFMAKFTASSIPCRCKV